MLSQEQLRQEELILSERRVSHARSFDALPCLESTLAELSEERFYLSYLRRAVAEDVIDEKRAMGDLHTILQTLDLLIDVNLRQYPVPVSALREEIGVLRAMKALELNHNSPARFTLNDFWLVIACSNTSNRQ